MHAQPRNNRPTRGFSLIELLVVMGIIALLAGVSFTVIGGAMQSSRRAATMTTITKVNKIYQQQLRGFYLHLDEDKALTNRLAGNFRPPGGQYQMTTDKEASLALARKLRVRNQFPQHPAEAAGFDGAIGTGDELPAFREWCRSAAMGGGIGSRDIPDDYTADSAELLYLICTESTIPGAPVLDAGFSRSELGDTDGDGWTEILDAWSQPLRFYRWPTRLINPGGYVFGVLGADVSPGDMSIPLDSSITSDPTFQDALALVTAADPSATIHVFIGDELIEVDGANATSLNVAPGGRGALSTDAAPHTTGTLVKLAPFTDVAAMLLGSLSTSVLAKDQDDRFGVMSDPRNLVVAPNVVEALLHTYSSYAPPLILSVGQDGDSGLGEPYEVGAMPSATSVTPTPTPWGNLARPRTFAYVVNPGSSPLADNLTNHMQGMGN
jgi:prepilin-type N-terminal cleavage/methylation domain-containing protein